MENVHIPWLLIPRLPNAHALRVRPTAGNMMSTSGRFRECQIGAMPPQGVGGNAVLPGKVDPLVQKLKRRFQRGHLGKSMHGVDQRSECCAQSSTLQVVPDICNGEKPDQHADGECTYSLRRSVYESCFPRHQMAQCRPAGGFLCCSKVLARHGLARSGVESSSAACMLTSGNGLGQAAVTQNAPQLMLNIQSLHESIVSPRSLPIFATHKQLLGFSHSCGAARHNSSNEGNSASASTNRLSLQDALNKIVDVAVEKVSRVRAELVDACGLFSLYKDRLHRVA